MKQQKQQKMNQLMEHQMQLMQVMQLLQLKMWIQQLCLNIKIIILQPRKLSKVMMI